MRRRLWKPPALLHCCREIRREASGLYYGNNIFRVDWTGGGKPEECDCTLVAWLETLGLTSRSLVRKVRLDDSWYDKDEVEERLQECRELLAKNSVQSKTLKLFVELYEPEYGEFWVSG